MSIHTPIINIIVFRENLVGGKLISRLFFCREVGAENFFVVSDENVLVGKCRVGPADAAALAELSFCGFDEFGAADFLITAGR